MGTVSDSYFSPTGGFGYDRRMILPIMPLKCQAVNNATQVVSNATFTKVNLQVINYDLSGSFSTSTSLFTAPITGYYWICGINAWSPNAVGRFISLLYVNGAEAAATRASLNVAGGLGGGQSNCNVSTYPTVLPLFKGDTVGLYCWQNTTVNQTLQSSAQDISALTVHFWSV